MSVPNQRPCRKCGCPIVLAPGPNGKDIPLDLRSPVYRLEPDLTGKVVAVRDTSAHVSHLAVCPARLRCAFCDERRFAKGLCNAHYIRKARGRDMLAPRLGSLSVEDRFWGKVVVADDCWLWASALDHNGYAMLWVRGGRSMRAHRFAFELLVGPIPNGMTLDHLCRVRECVNPGHLDPCTAGENASRSPSAPYWRKARQTHCLRGHPLDAENTRFARNGASRSCKACDRIRYTQRKAAR